MDFVQVKKIAEKELLELKEKLSESETALLL
jgi:hypothetical protein